MALSTEFIKLLKEFVSTYKLKGSSSFLSWSKEPNHQELCELYKNRLVQIEETKEGLNEISVILEFNKNILLNAKTNPFLIDCWSTFFEQYSNYKRNLKSNSILSNNIQEENLFEKMTLELQKSLISMKEMALLERQSHNTETLILKKKIEELQEENLQLLKDNHQLKRQAYAQETLNLLNKPIEEAKTQLKSMMELLDTLDDLTKKTSSTIDFKSQGSFKQISTEFTKKEIIDKEKNVNENLLITSKVNSDFINSSQELKKQISTDNLNIEKINSEQKKTENQSSLSTINRDNKTADIILPPTPPNLKKIEIKPNSSSLFGSTDFLKAIKDRKEKLNKTSHEGVQKKNN